MRTLLISSQKGGVGKTTTSINLAALAGGSGMRVLLVDCDPASGVSSSLTMDADAPIGQLPGVEIIGLDEGESGDLEALRRLLSRVKSAGRSGDFDLAILDSPPFLGEWLGSLLAVSDEVILVMRSDPLAFRTLPAFLEALQAHSPMPLMRGILLTLPPHDRWESEIRAQLDPYLLPVVIPHDPSVTVALLGGVPVVMANPGALSSRSYRDLAESLGLIIPGVTPRSGQNGTLMVGSRSR